MSEMVERVAMAIKANLENDGDVYFRDDGETCLIDGHVRIEDFARAAIEAVREPTDAVVDAGRPFMKIGPFSVFQVMLDAALKE